MKRRFHNSDGSVVMREPSDDEVTEEWEMRKKDPMFRAQIKTIAELTKKKEQDVEDTMKKHYFAVWKE